MEIRGLDRLQRRLRDLEHSARSLEGSHEIPLAELLPDTFVSRHSRFANLTEMLSAGGVAEGSDIEADAWRQFVSQETDFSSWTEMCQAAAIQWTRRRLGFKDEG